MRMSDSSSNFLLVRCQLAIAVRWAWSVVFLFFSGGCDLQHPSLPVQLQPVQEAVLDERYTVMEMSDDGHVQALSTGIETIKGDNQKPFLTLIDASSMAPVMAPLAFDDWVTHIEFVSNEFGFLVAVSPESSSSQGVEKERQSQLLGSIHRVGLDGNRKVVSDGLPVPLTSLTVSSNHRIAAVCSRAQFGEDAQCRFINLEDGAIISVVSPPFSEHLSATFSRDSRYGVIIASGRNRLAVGRAEPTPDQSDGQILLVNIADGELVRKKVNSTFDGNSGLLKVRSSETSGEQHISYENHNSITSIIVDSDQIQIQEILKASQLNGHAGFEVFDFDFDAVSNRIAVADRYTGSHTGSAVLFFDLQRQKLANCGIRRKDWMYQARFSPDGRSLFALVQVKRRDFRSVSSLQTSEHSWFGNLCL